MKLRTDVSFTFCLTSYRFDNNRAYKDGIFYYIDEFNSYIPSSLQSFDDFGIDYKKDFIKAYKKACYKQDMENILK